jgi:hypothetical protein
MSDYRELKTGCSSGFSAGIINSQYAISVPMGICDVPEYYPISKEEFDTFLDWIENNKNLYEITAREPIKELKK